MYVRDAVCYLHMNQASATNQLPSLMSVKHRQAVFRMKLFLKQHRQMNGNVTVAHKYTSILMHHTQVYTNV